MVTFYIVYGFIIHGAYGAYIHADHFLWYFYGTFASFLSLTASVLVHCNCMEIRMQNCWRLQFGWWSLELQNFSLGKANKANIFHGYSKMCLQEISLAYYPIPKLPVGFISILPKIPFPHYVKHSSLLVVLHNSNCVWIYNFGSYQCPLSKNLFKRSLIQRKKKRYLWDRE